MMVESNGCVLKIQASLYAETNHATFKKNSQVMRHVLVSFGSVYGADKHVSLYLMRKERLNFSGVDA